MQLIYGMNQQHLKAREDHSQTDHFALSVISCGRQYLIESDCSGLWFDSHQACCPCCQVVIIWRSAQTPSLPPTAVKRCAALNASSAFTTTVKL